MTTRITRGGAALLLALAAGGVQAQQKPVDIGFIGTLSTPAGYIGEDERDAFMLAVKEGGGKLGGVPVNVRVEDDALKPANAKQIADKMVQGGVRLFTGINFSNVMAAVGPTVLNAGGFYVSLNAGPSNYAGKACNPNYFSVAFQNDSYADTAGIAANELGAKRIVVMAPNYQAGRDAVAGFKRTYKGEIADEIYTKLEQADFSVELARIRSLNPDAIFQFHPGGAGINLTKQFANSGLADKIKMITPIYSMDERMLAATGNAGKGFYLSSLWSADLDNPQNKHFVEAFTKAYNRAPTAYAAQAYDTANLIGSGLKAVGGDITGKADAFREALRRADFPSVRGKFK
ncbi:ABC transporter substrate-binding protein, partial [Achromobacter xylosoxidans]|uniref:ABC transporter substrate-binding protein n=2 Tax=Alcaligenaceae TaxID=506 RepID=UPI001F0FDB8A